MKIKSVANHKKVSRTPTSFPCITISPRYDNIIGILTYDGHKDYWVTVIGNPSPSFPIGWRGTTHLEANELYDGCVTLSNDG